MDKRNLPDSHSRICLCCCILYVFTLLAPVGHSFTRSTNLPFRCLMASAEISSRPFTTSCFSMAVDQGPSSRYGLCTTTIFYKCWDYRQFLVILFLFSQTYHSDTHGQHLQLGRTFLICCFCVGIDKSCLSFIDCGIYQCYCLL